MPACNIIFARFARTLFALAVSTAFLGTFLNSVRGGEIGALDSDGGGSVTTTKNNNTPPPPSNPTQILNPGEFTTQPANQSIVAGFGTTFTGVAFMDSSTYQWQISTNHGKTWSDLSDNASLSGSNTTTLTVSNATLAMNGLQFRVMDITNTSVSNTANLTVLPLLIDVPPGNQTAAAGTTVTFTTHVVSSSNVTYQWLKNNLAIKGATQANLTLTNVQASNAGTYGVKATNHLGSVKSPSAKLTVTKAAPTIVTPPSPATVLVGAKATFTVSAQGTQPFTYRWTKTGGHLANSSTITGVFTPTLTLKKTTSVSGGTYQVTITNSAGQVTSTPVSLNLGSSIGTIPGGSGTGPTVFIIND